MARGAPASLPDKNMGIGNEFDKAAEGDARFAG
jgi:hypothetical protein